MAKMLSYNINGKLFRLIHNMYQNIKSCISHNGQQSAYFQCFRGVRQGENLSPILFAIFLNDCDMEGGLYHVSYQFVVNMITH